MPLPSRVPVSAAVRLGARLGFAALGVVYFILGGLAVLAAAGVHGGKTADKQQVLSTVLDLPAGRVLLGALAVGLAGYVLWRLAEAFLDTEGKGKGARGLAVRIGYLASAVMHGALAVAAARAAWNNHADGDKGPAFGARFMAHDWAHLVLGAVGVAMIGFALWQVYRAFAGKMMKEVDCSSLEPAQRRLVLRAGQIGNVARALVLGVLGALFIRAARAAHRTIDDTETAFDFLAGIGPPVLGLVALGVVAYGLYMMVRARFPLLRA